jgi:hypothetical protein
MGLVIGECDSGVTQKSIHRVVGWFLSRLCPFPYIFYLMYLHWADVLVCFYFHVVYGVVRTDHAYVTAKRAAFSHYHYSQHCLFNGSSLL